MAQRPAADGRGRPSVYDVAERAGVSIATVSRTLRGSAPVSATTRERVLAAARELRWRPSRLARAFVEQTHGAVGIVFPDLGGQYYPSLIAGFEAAAAERGVAVLIAATHGRPDTRELVTDFAERVDGLVVTGRTVDDQMVASLARADRPIVLLARPPVGEVAAVRAANAKPAAALTEHVLSHGCRHVVFLGETQRSTDVAERWRGVRRALRHAGVGTDDVLVRSGGFDADHGYKAGLDLFAARPGVDAVMCANDDVAAGVVAAANDSGRRVPRDVVVTGWDDTALAARMHPPLSTVRQPIHELGRRAAERLFAQLDGDDPSSVVLDTALVIRESCGCPASADPGGRAWVGHPSSRCGSHHTKRSSS